MGRETKIRMKMDLSWKQCKIEARREKSLKYGTKK